MKRVFLLYPAVLLCLLALGAFFATSGLAAPVSDAQPVKVTSDNMTYDTAKNTVIFTGNVEVTRGTFQMWAATITMYMKDAPKANAKQQGAAPVPTASTASTAPSAPTDAFAGTGDIDRIVAEKNVRFRYNTQKGEAAKATYTTANGVLLLEGNPILRDGENSITGQRIRYFTQENRSEVLGAPGKRVEAVFSSQSRKDK